MPYLSFALASPHDPLSVWCRKRNINSNSQSSHNNRNVDDLSKQKPKKPNKRGNDNGISGRLAAISGAAISPYLCILIFVGSAFLLVSILEQNQQQRGIVNGVGPSYSSFSPLSLMERVQRKEQQQPPALRKHPARTVSNVVRASLSSSSSLLLLSFLKDATQRRSVQRPTAHMRAPEKVIADDDRYDYYEDGDDFNSTNTNDYGGLVFSFLITNDKNKSHKKEKDNNEFIRKIQVDHQTAEANAPYFRRQTEMGGVPDDESPLEDEHGCRPTAFQRHNHRPICNHMQEIGFERAVRDNKAKHLAQGGMSDIFYARDETNLELVFKEKLVRSLFRKGTQMGYNYIQDFERQEAMFGSALSPHPLIVQNYGYCGLVTMSEFLKSDNLEDVALKDDPFCSEDPHNGTPPMDLSTVLDRPLLVANNFTLFQKLQLCLDMAESLALLHNHPQGVLVHADMYLSQYLVIEDKNHKGLLRLKLTDFNDAAILKYNPTTKQYCPFQHRPGHCYSTSPEDFAHAYSGEQRDVFRVANSMYSVLTGYELWPHVCKFAEKQAQIRDYNKRSFIDPRWFTDRTPAEAALMELIRTCWRTKPEDRPSIGQVVIRLREIMQQHLQEQQPELPSSLWSLQRG